MNVRVGDIIKLENNQFVAVSVALRRARSQLGSAQGQQRTAWCCAHSAFALLHHLLGWRHQGHQPGSCI